MKKQIKPVMTVYKKIIDLGKNLQEWSCGSLVHDKCTMLDAGQYYSARCQCAISCGSADDSSYHENVK